MDKGENGGKEVPWSHARPCFGTCTLGNVKLGLNHRVRQIVRYHTLCLTVPMVKIN